MIAGLDPSALAELALMLVAVGALAGFLAGVFGIGGGAVLVPVFYECFRLAGVPLEVRMPLCVGTSLAVIIPTSISSFRAHYFRGAVDMNILKIWWLPIVIGVVAGSITARFAPERLFKYVFVMVAWSAATRLLLARENWKFGDEMPKGPVMRLFGFLVGILATLMGVGGGLFSNLLMTFYSRPIHQAVATSSALAVLISIPGALGYIYAGWPQIADPQSILQRLNEEQGLTIVLVTHDRGRPHVNRHVAREMAGHDETGVEQVCDLGGHNNRPRKALIALAAEVVE